MTYLKLALLWFVCMIQWGLLNSGGLCQTSIQYDQPEPGFLDPPDNVGLINSTLASRIGSDFWYLVKSPMQMSRKERLALAYLAAANVIFIYGVDNNIDRRFAAAELPYYLKPLEPLADIGDLYDQLGPGYIMAGISVSMLTGGILIKDRKLLETARLMLESAAFTSIVTHSAKGIFSRSRPYTNRGAQDFDLLKFRLNSRYKALPSGHASHVFAMVTVIVKQYNKWWLKVPAYTLAGSVALQRMDDRRHWFSDVLVGGLIGYWVSNRLVNRYKKPRGALPIKPYASAKGIGVSLDL